MVQSASLTRKETWRLLLLVGVCLGIIVNTFQGDGAPLVASLAFSGIAYAIAFSMIRWLGPVFMKAGLKGKDMAKPRRPEMYGLICMHFLCSTLTLSKQSGDNGRSLCHCVPSPAHRLHPVCVLQRHRGGDIRRRQSRRRHRSASYRNRPVPAPVPAQQGWQPQPLACCRIPTDARFSWLRICPDCCHCRPSSSSASEMTCSTSDGATKS